MRKVEFVQSGYLGGFPDGTGIFKHGEALYLVSQKELKELQQKFTRLEEQYDELKEKRGIELSNAEEKIQELEATLKDIFGNAPDTGWPK